MSIRDYVAVGRYWLTSFLLLPALHSHNFTTIRAVVSVCRDRGSTPQRERVRYGAAIRGADAAISAVHQVQDGLLKVCCGRNVAAYIGRGVVGRYVGRMHRPLKRSACQAVLLIWSVDRSR